MASAGSVVAAWMVHLYTGLGLPINYLAVRSIYVQHDFATFCYLNWLAIFVDATDGTLARKVDVKSVLPGFDGAGLDNIIDFLTFSFLPTLCISAFELIPAGPLQVLISVLSLLASGYQFCQKVAKTEEAFIGFPSYWNLLFFYLYLLRPSVPIIVTCYVACAILSFVPFRFVYPSRTKYMQKTTLVLGALWSVAMVVPVVAPQWKYSELTLKCSLVYVAYYIVLSCFLHFRGPRSKAD